MWICEDQYRYPAIQLQRIENREWDISCERENRNQKPELTVDNHIEVKSINRRTTTMIVKSSTRQNTYQLFSSVESDDLSKWLRRISECRNKRFSNSSSGHNLNKNQEKWNQGLEDIPTNPYCTVDCRLILLALPSVSRIAEAQHLIQHWENRRFRFPFRFATVSIPRNQTQKSKFYPTDC